MFCITGAGTGWPRGWPGILLAVPGVSRHAPALPRTFRPDAVKNQKPLAKTPSCQRPAKGNGCLLRALCDSPPSREAVLLSPEFIHSFPAVDKFLCLSDQFSVFASPHATGYLLSSDSCLLTLRFLESDGLHRSPEIGPVFCLPVSSFGVCEPRGVSSWMLFCAERVIFNGERRRGKDLSG